MEKYIMSLDQGTTSSRCMLFRKDGSVGAVAQKEITPIFPTEGWVEQDPMEIWSTQIAVATEALHKIGGDWSQIAGIGITNQRETVVVWDTKTGTPIYNAIVWQCRRTAQMCDRLRDAGLETMIRNKTGLLLDPYFSATKLAWILDNIPDARQKAERGEIAFGTVDSWLLWKLTGGAVHATDMTNAARTMLFNIHTLKWDDELLELFNVPISIMPKVFPSANLFGYTCPKVIGASIPIGGIAGDQQAALFGQCCFAAGEMKNTYGTGAFLLMNTGDKAFYSDRGLITTLACSADGSVSYALEGSVFTCGAAVQWLRDGLKIIENAKESEFFASQVDDTAGVMVVPAFQGLGAPYWDPYARGVIIGITRATNKNHIIRATLESIAFQTADIVHLMEDACGINVTKLNVDGGASANDLLMQIQSDLLGIDICRPVCIESTALGAAYLCGLTLGIYTSLDDIRKNSSTERVFYPTKTDIYIDEKMKLWHKAVERSLEWA